MRPTEIMAKLPNLKKAAIKREKIEGYLLSSVHSIGRGKAKFFTKYGFVRERWHQLEQALLAHAASNDVRQAIDNDYGRKYVIEGPLLTPDGRSPFVRAIWLIGNDTGIPEFVTAYPCDEK